LFALVPWCDVYRVMARSARADAGHEAVERVRGSIGRVRIVVMHHEEETPITHEAQEAAHLRVENAPAVEAQQHPGRDLSERGGEELRERVAPRIEEDIAPAIEPEHGARVRIGGEEPGRKAMTCEYPAQRHEPVRQRARDLDDSVSDRWQPAQHRRDRR